MMPLAMAKIGETVTIRKITGRDDVRQHLAVVSEAAGNLILQVKDSWIALNKAMATRIMF